MGGLLGSDRGLNPKDWIKGDVPTGQVRRTPKSEAAETLPGNDTGGDPQRGKVCRRHLKGKVFVTWSTSKRVVCRERTEVQNEFEG